MAVCIKRTPISLTTGVQNSVYLTELNELLVFENEDLAKKYLSIILKNKLSILADATISSESFDGFEFPDVLFSCWDYTENKWDYPFNFKTIDECLKATAESFRQSEGNMCHADNCTGCTGKKTCLLDTEVVISVKRQVRAHVGEIDFDLCDDNVEHIIAGDQPATCYTCGSRLTFISQIDDNSQHEICEKCRIFYRIYNEEE